jgi:hypothetical protein
MTLSADRLDLLFAVKWLVVVRRTVLPSVDAMQRMSPDNLHMAGLERTAYQQRRTLACSGIVPSLGRAQTIPRIPPNIPGLFWHWVLP